MSECLSLHDPLVQIQQAEVMLAETVWPGFEATCYSTSERVFEAFQRHRVGAEHFASVTGYGHDDLGRQVIDRVFADALEAEAALVRVQFVSGTHAIAVALNACLGAGKQMVVVTGPPYDTLEEVIGIRGAHPLSLKGRGVAYQEINCFDNPVLTDFLELHQDTIQQADLLYIQRSRGYSSRVSLSEQELRPLIARLKSINPDAVVFVDNCYGEFTEAHEPTAYGADLIAGSLIKNPGGGIVTAGGYVAGRTKWVELAACALTCPGIGSQGGYTFEQSRLILQGLFLAPSVVKETLKGMSLAAYLLEEEGYATLPRWDALRSDIIQTIQFGNREQLIGFCQCVQRCSPVDSAVLPVPSEVPGYGDDIIMAGGTFIEGSTIELSADGPLRPPYNAYFQGGLTYAHVRYAMSRWLAVFKASS